MSSPLAIRRAPPERVQPNTTTSDMRWWSYERGAQWRHPRGASSTVDGLERHPVVQFPWQKTRQDGSDFTSPGDTFPPNAYGVHDMIGNVWEWTTAWYRAGHSMEKEEGCCSRDDARVIADPRDTAPIPRKVRRFAKHGRTRSARRVS